MGRGISPTEPDPANTGEIRASGSRGQPETSNYGGGVNWRIVPAKNAALLHQLRPYLAKNLQETVEGIHSEGGVDRLPLLDHLGVDDPVGVEEGEDPLLHVASMHPLPKLGLDIPF